MRFGRYDVSTVVLGTFRLDGGAMFGSVPKNLWSKRIPVDDENCIPLATRSLLIRGDSRVVLVDVGMGEKWNEKSREIYAIKNTPPSALGFSPDEITDVILTHLHFDHAGGISRYKNGTNGEVELCYPQARVFLQAANLENAKNPSLKERASYLKENVLVLDKAKLELVRGTTEVLPDIWVHQFDGHTVGQQSVEIRNGDRSMVFPTDLIPTARHLPVPFHMGYDNCAGTVLKEKEAFLNAALERRSVVVFEHDPDTAAGTITKDERGHFTLDERVEL